MDAALRDEADRVRSLIAGGRCEPPRFRELLVAVPAVARDAWVDRALGLREIPDDGAALPRGCVPYLPCAVDTLIRLTEHAPVAASDVFVDVGSGLGRASALVHLLTGAQAIGVEIQPALVEASRALAADLCLESLSFLQGDAVEIVPALGVGSVFLLYCPFSGERLAKLLFGLESIPRQRAIRLCCVDLPLPPCPWLEWAPPPSHDLAIYRARI
jgi:SAM-dependent methyltransferase